MLVDIDRRQFRPTAFKFNDINRIRCVLKVYGE